MDPKHWAEVRAWEKDSQLHIETGGSALLPKTPDGIPQTIATLRKNIERAQAMSPQVCIYCTPITARPPVVPVYSEEFWALARRGRPWNKPHLMADLLKYATATWMRRGRSNWTIRSRAWPVAATS